MLARSNKLNIERGKDMRKDELNLKELEKELTALQIMAKLGMISIEEFERVMGEIGKEHNIRVVLRNRNKTTNQTSVKVLA